MRVSKNRDERYQEFVQVAERLFMTRGYEETGVSDIVRETGVAQGTFYYHFKSKEDVLVAVVRKTVGELEARVKAIVEDQSVDPVARIHRLMDLMFENAVQRSDLIAYIHRDSNAALHHRLMGTNAAMVRRHLLALIREGVEKGCFQVAHPEETVDFFLGGVTGMFHAPGLFGEPARMQRFREVAEASLRRSLGQAPHSGA